MLNQVRNIIWILCLTLAPCCLSAQSLFLPPLPTLGKNDTIPHVITLYDGDWVLYRYLPEVTVFATISREQYKKWVRMQNAVYKVYPYMKAMGKIILETRQELDAIKDKREREKHLKKKEKELLAAFTGPMKKLSRYQGSVLIRLVNRETGNTCYELLREYKGAFSSNLWQGFALLFGNSLKREYSPDTDLEDSQIEDIVTQLENEMYHP